MTIALIDGDLIAYRAALGPQETYEGFEGTEDGTLKTTNPKAAALAAIKLVEEWADKVSANDLIVCLTGPDKFRTRLLPTYNHNRKGEKPLAHGAAVASIKERFRHYLINGLEADDLLGILMTTPRYVEQGGVIVSVDKDLRTIPGRLFNPTKDRKARLITPPEANHWWMMQTLMGDVTDGYKGLPGVGEAKATKILGGPGAPLRTLWQAVLKAYLDKKLTEQDALTQARMARILRREDYDSKTKEITLWHPTTPVRIPLVAPPSVGKGSSKTGKAR